MVRLRLVAVSAAAVVASGGVLWLAGHRGDAGAATAHGAMASLAPATQPATALVTAGPPSTPAPSRAATPAHGAASAAATPVPWFTARLASACVVPGGSQTLVAQSRPGYTVAFNSSYADGQRGDLYGGYGVVPSDATGHVTARWGVAGTAPLGRVTVEIGTGDGGAATTLRRSFTLAAHC
jgi:hypothetical protein